MLIWGVFGPEKAFQVKNHPEKERGFCVAMASYASTRPVSPRLCALCSYLCESVYFCCATHFLLAATPLSLPGAGTVHPDISGIIVFHANVTIRWTISVRDLTRYRVSWGFPPTLTLIMLTCCHLYTKTLKSRRQWHQQGSHMHPAYWTRHRNSQL